MFALKDYQEWALDALRDYFQECSRTDDADTSFYSVTQHCPVRFLHEQFPGFVDSACQADRVAFVIH